MIRLDTDVLVIGTGAAGLYAAVTAARAGVRVLVVDKGLVSRSGGTVAASGMAAVGPWHVLGDSPDAHFRDTVSGGCFLNEQPLARVLVEEAPERVREMETWGLRFDREADGRYVLDAGGGHSYRRLLAISDRVGLQISKILETQLICNRVERHSDVLVTRLLVRDGRVVGALGLDLGADDFIQIHALAVVLATGGIGQLYPATTNPINCTGDGLALALQAGAKLLNMEQVQFYPSCLVDPPSLRGFGLGIQEYACLYNSESERFMARYEPEALEHTTRDRLSRAIYSEITAGRGLEHGGVYLDATGLPEETFRSFSHELELCRERGLDLQTQRAEVAPAAHYFMGGLAIDRDGQTSLPGLFAAGEVTGGVHGANRLNGNSLADGTVFGARAGASAAGYARGCESLAIEGERAGEEEARLRGLLNRTSGGLTSAEGKNQLRRLMWTRVGVVRNGHDLAAALDILAEMKDGLLPRVNIPGDGRRPNRTATGYLELENMVCVAMAIACSALARTESRGAHSRLDYPAPDRTSPPLHTQVVWDGADLRISQRPSCLTELQAEREVS